MLKRKLDSLEQNKDTAMEFDDLSSMVAHRRTDVDKFQSLRNLRNKVKLNTNLSHRELISSHSFVGNIDREFALIQHNTSLYIANTPVISRQLFYQIILRDFGNFNAIRLNPPVPINILAKLALDDTGKKTQYFTGSLHSAGFLK